MAILTCFFMYTPVWVTSTQAMTLVELVMLAVAMITTSCLFRSDSKFTSTIGIAFISVACKHV
ncbi:hypothetical protein DPMN_034892 [Dreissena polymorpha]|uniref:Uncharacterized protein n=1 Tax=Dreissena polymorpha TaxID=45954 RepID=A0A9D4RK43_DREPO|nr:hypothetical protein DPMN_034892 [Dreissena polymorpha]